jgi:hypothetical protein
MPTLLLSDAVKNLEADALAAVITHLSIHTATTGTTGVAEAVGGSPAYARKAVTFNAAGTVGPLGAAVQPATVGIAWSTQAVFDLPAGTYPFWGAWNALTSGLFRMGRDFSSARVLGTQDILPMAIGIGPAVGA